MACVHHVEEIVVCKGKILEMKNKNSRRMIHESTDRSKKRFKTYKAKKRWVTALFFSRRVRSCRISY